MRLRWAMRRRLPRMPVELVKVAPLESDGSGAKWTVRGLDTRAGGGVGVGTLRGGSEGDTNQAHHPSEQSNHRNTSMK